MAQLAATKKVKTYPLHLFIGIALVGFFWFASWMHLGLLGEYAFFPQWLGYILTMDALVVIRKGSSILTRSRREFAALFLLSVPIWWVFEGLNNFLVNWHYLGEDYSYFEMVLIGSVDFSTVIPAIFETTELVLTFPFIRQLQTARQFSVSRSGLWFLMYLGAFSLAAVILVPQFAFPLAWLWLVLLADPLNWMRGRRSLFAQISSGDWRMVAALALAGTLCGLFWETWNYYAFPKWYYTVPFVGFAKIWEMPLLGYGGYWPFAWELYAFYHLVWGVIGRPATWPSLEEAHESLQAVPA